jgi:hypothetical protein
MNIDLNKDCIDACLQCFSACLNCAGRDHKEGSSMGNCAQINMECAAVCNAAAKLMSLGSKYAKEVCLICVKICTECAEECEKHDKPHCRECAQACRECAEHCEKMAGRK